MTLERIEAAIVDARRPLDDLAAMLRPLKDPAMRRVAQRAYALPLANEGPKKWMRRSLVAAMAGNVDADTVLSEFTAASIEKGDLPAELRTYAAMKVRGQSKRRPGPNKQTFNLIRDGYIFIAILIAMGHGFKPTRSKARSESTESACSIVVKALDRVGPPLCMSEALVEAVWNNMISKFREAGPDAIADLCGERPHN